MAILKLTLCIITREVALKGYKKNTYTLANILAHTRKEGEYTQFTLTFPNRLKIKKNAIRGRGKSEGRV
jgi:hypothetical protein